VRCLWQINIAGLNDREIKRVVDEIRLLKKLKHPYLIKFDSAFTKGSDRIIFITELMTSGTLQECVQGVSMPLSPSPPHPMHPRLMPLSCIPQPICWWCWHTRQRAEEGVGCGCFCHQCCALCC
jgi:hypothetical protein